jgi:hypothetical protein
MPKVFKDPIRHFKPSDHHNKPHITLVNGLPVKNLANYIYNGIKEIGNENIVRSTNQRGYSIIYFTDPKKSFESSFLKNKDDIKQGRAKLKFFMAGLALLCEKEFNAINNEKIKLAINDLRKLAHDFDHDVKAGDLKKPLEIILKETTTPKEVRREKIVSPHRFHNLKVRGVNRQALYRFNKMDDVELENLINSIYLNTEGDLKNKEEILAFNKSAKASIRIMQKFINVYIHLRTTTTSGLVKIANSMENLDGIEKFCQGWSKFRKDLINQPYIKARNAIHGWASEMDKIVAVLNKRLFQTQSANTPYAKIFNSGLNGPNVNIFTSPFSPAAPIPETPNQLPSSILSPGYLIEDSADKRLFESIIKATPNFSGNIKRVIQFNDSPSYLGGEDVQSPNSAYATPEISEDTKSNKFLSPSIEEIFKSDVMSTSDEFLSFMSPINSPSAFPQKQLQSIVHRQPKNPDEHIANSLTKLSLNTDSSTESEESFTKIYEGGLNSQQVDFLTQTIYHDTEYTPEKPDPDSRLAIQIPTQSASRKASVNSTVESMPAQSMLRNASNTSSTNSTNNAF